MSAFGGKADIGRTCHSSVADLEEQLNRQAYELEEAREERAATADVLATSGPGKFSPGQ